MTTTKQPELSLPHHVAFHRIAVHSLRLLLKVFKIMAIIKNIPVIGSSYTLVEKRPLKMSVGVFWPEASPSERELNVALHFFSCATLRRVHNVMSLAIYCKDSICTHFASDVNGGSEVHTQTRMHC